MSDVDVLELLKSGAYHVDVEAGVVFAKDGTPLAIDNSGSGDDRDSVVLFDSGRRRKIAVGKVVWMAATGCVVPEGFQVHHDDEDKHNHAFANLMCIHRLDHAKFHAASEEPIPF